MAENQYKIVRFYRDDETRRDLVETGLTLKEAQEHCQDPETCSKTATTPEGIERTRRFGEWFDGYDAE